MKHSIDRILTTHVGSLIRPQELREFLRAKEAGLPFDQAAYAICLKQAVAEVVRRQAEIGIDVISDGEVVEADPPRKLVQTWRMTMTPEMAAEAFTRLTYDIESVRGGVTKLTVTHDVTGAPMWAEVLRGEGELTGAGGGWSEILSGLKTLLETGQQLPFQSGPA